MYSIDIIFGVLAALGGLLFYHRQPELWLRLLVWLIIAGIALETAAASKIVPEAYNHAFFNTFTIIAICVNLYCFYCVLNNPALKKLSLYSIPVFLAICIINFLFFQSPLKFNTVNYRIGSVIIIFLCFMYYRQLLLDEYQVTIFRTPMFFVATGLLFFYAGFFISFTAFDFISRAQFESNKLFWKFLTRFLNVLNYTLLLTAFICRHLPKKSYR